MFPILVVVATVVVVVGAVVVVGVVVFLILAMRNGEALGLGLVD